MVRQCIKVCKFDARNVRGNNKSLNVQPSAKRYLAQFLLHLVGFGAPALRRVNG